MPQLLGGERGLAVIVGRPGARSCWPASVSRSPKQEAAAFRELTHRAPPGHQVKQLWAVVGRRGGKSKSARRVSDVFLGLLHLAARQ